MSTTRTERRVENREDLKKRLAARTVQAVDGCLIWTGGSRSGYGLISFHGKKLSTHQAAYLAEHGCIPQGQLVRHTCRQPLCVNPAHLVLGTDESNAQDAIDHGTSAGLMPRKRLPERTRRAVISLAIDGFSRHEIHRLFQLPISTVKKIVRTTLTQ